MKHIYSKFPLFILVLFLAFNSFGQSGIFESYVIVDGVFYDIHSPTDTGTNAIPSTQDFNGFNFGPIPTSTGSLLLNGGQNNIYKCPTHDVTTGVLDYVIYPTGSRPATPTFTGINLNDSVATINNTACFGSGFDQAWLRNDANIDLISGLASGDYTLEAYTLADYTVNGVLSPTPHYVNNNANNFTATFRADNPPVANCVSALTVQLDASGNATITVADINDGSSDDFDTPTLSIDINTFDCTNIGTPVTVTLTAEDTLGQTDTCTVDVIVEDDIAPVADLATLADITAECEVSSLTPPTATDNCGGTVTVTNDATLPISGEGTTTLVTWTYDDGNGNTSTQTQNVIINDITAPVADLATLADITAECEVTTLTPPTATDNCGGTVTVTNDATLPISGEGTTTLVTWTYDDGNGNTSTQTQNVIINDITAPVADLATLADITAECEVTSLTPPTATDNCGGTVTVTNDATLPISGEGTATVVTWTYDDGNGNTSTQTQNVIINDITAPVADLATLADITAECEVSSLTPPTATDNCGGTVTVTNNATLPISGQGSTTITWTYDDGNGNTSTQTQNVIINDITAPVADLATLADITAECEVTSLTPPTATDNCGGTVTVTNDATLPISGEGTTTLVTWTYDDGNGNTSTQTQNVIINDITAPVADLATLADITAECEVTTLTPPTATDNCGGTVTVTNNATLPISGQGSSTITWTYDDGNGNTSTQTQNVIINDITAPVADLATLADITAECEVTTLTPPTATDNCGGTVTVTNDATLPISGEGTTTLVTWTYDDGNGNTSTQTQNVIINDITAPVADLATLADITAECEVSSLTPPTATDNCGGTVTVTNNATLPISGQGSSTITWTYDDGNGNTSTQTQNVIINDITAPVADLATLADITAECEVTSLTPPTATDNCGGTVSVTNNATLPILGEGTTTVVTWTYDDGNGNTSTQTQNVIINDITAPVADLATLADITAECEVTSLTPPTATDNCGGTVTVTNNATLPISGQGSSIITWTYDDGNGNTSTQTQNVIINDITAPVADLATLADITAECEVSSLTPPTATDNCGGTVTVTNDATLPISGEGTTTVVTWTYDDGNGNTSTQTQNVIINDMTAPVADLATLADITAECEVTTLTPPTATDNCGGTVTVTNNATLPISGQGSSIITWTYDDGNGNTSTQTQNVIINDITAPVADLATLADITAECEVTSLTPPTATDNCGGTVSVTNNATLPILGEGTTTVVTWTYDDGNGNTSTQTQNVIINDITAPVADLATLADITAECEVTSLTPPTATDNCGGTVTVTNDATLPISGEGTTTVVTWTYDDGNGNTSTQTQNVIINDITAPVADLATLADITAECEVSSLTPPTATDNCGGTVTVTNNATLPISGQGSTIITWTYNDGNGNTSSQTQTVIIDDVTPPVAVCQNFTVPLDGSGNASITVADIDNGSSDNCAIASISLDITTFDCSNLGSNPATNTVTLTVRDIANNVTTCTAVVTVTDPAENATVTIAVDNNPICAGDSATFTVDTTVDSGATPIFEWFVNGSSEAINVSTFTPLTPLSDNDEVYVTMISSLSACSIPTTSPSIFMVVNPLPVVSGPANICVGNTGNLSPATSGWVSTSGFATVNSSGVVSANSAGTATFTYTDANGCSENLSIVINPLPTITNLPSNNDICVNETHTLSPTSGGTWSSSDNTIATVDNSGVITGQSAGNVTFTFTTSSGCSATTPSIEVLAIPEFDTPPITVSENSVCAGDPSNLTANILGAGSAAATLVNYNFDSGNNYGQLNGQEAPGITSTASGTIDFFRTTNGFGVDTTPAAFTQNTAGNVLVQFDDWTDGGFFGGTDDSGNWRFDLGGPNLPNYQNFSVYFQARRFTRFGNNKSIIVQYRANNVGGWNTLGTLNINNNTNWRVFNQTLPASVNNPNDLDFRLLVNDGSTGAFWFANEPHILLDNFQVQASIVGDTFEYAWTANTGANAGLPANAGTFGTNNNQVTVNPQVTTDYTVTVRNSDGCPVSETVTVNVFSVPTLNILADYCPAPPNANFVELVANGTGFVDYEWNTGETTQTIYVDVAGSYQVIATTSQGCSVSATINVAQELVVNGDFSGPAPTTNGDFGPDAAANYAALGFDYDEDYAFPFNNGYRYFVNPTLFQNRLTITTDSGPFYPGIFRSVSDHTGDAAAQFLAVNGDDLTLAVWRQEITVEPNTNYYFSAWGIDISDPNNAILLPSDLRFRINGVDQGSVLDLVKGDDWERFYGIWDSQGNTTAIVEIRNVDAGLQGNNFAIDDVSFATLSTFIRLTSAVTTDTQTVCQNTPIVDITYDIGGGLTAPDIQWTLNGTPLNPINTMPDGLTATFDGLEYLISGTPTQFGTYEYTITTTSTCDVKSASGTLTVEEAPVVTIPMIAAPICFSAANTPVSATLSGSATNGTWSTSGTGTFTGVSGDGTLATYNFGATETGFVTLTFTSNDPAGTCDAAIADTVIEITPYVIANAGLPIDNSTSNCADLTVTLGANNVTGQWTVTSGQDPSTYFFSNSNAYNSSFTGESGEVYTLRWEAVNVGPCLNTEAFTTVTFADCGDSLIFDGIEDYISFANNYDLDASAFSIEAWIKADNVSGTKTIISKRNSANLNSGYDLSLINNRIYFRWNNQELFSTATINNTKWYHVALTYNGANYNLYIDGFPVRTNISGASPIANTNKALIGAMDTTNNNPVNYFQGGIDEVRIWDTAISLPQIKEMMNQEIEANGNNVRGVVVPLDITGNLQWNSLIGYYQMRFGPQSNVSNGNIQDIAISAVQGKLNKMTAVQAETAPIPYLSGANNDWDNQTTWVNGNVQQIPNSRANSLTGLEQTWNIVRTATNVNTDRPTNINNRTTLFGLLVDSNRLSIEANEPIIINKYLRIDGTLDLVGESQLLQPMGSIVDYLGTGQLERDQQGTSNLFNYNYWTSPVSVDGTTFTIASVLYDGTTVSNPQPLQWTTAQNSNASTSPKTQSSRWLYAYINQPENSYADWQDLDQNSALDVGLGFTMKGSGAGSSDQNYTFVGQPNNGTITSPVSGGYQALVGNPYPSAIDGYRFINDNMGVLSDGSIALWEHAASNNSHVLTAYEGGYALLSLSGGVAAVSPPEIFGTGSANKVPGQFIPVGQGFFVTGNATGGNITFNNAQRVFRTEGANSVFLRTDGTTGEETAVSHPSIRIDFITPENAVRHLLLAFVGDDNATDGIDYGYDALNSETLPSDMSFNIEGEQFVIQGVGDFDISKLYALDINMENAGTVQIALDAIENFEDNEEINVYIFDTLDGSYTHFNNQNYQITLEPGTYTNRFFLAFQEDTTLSTIDTDFKDIIVNYLQNTDEIYVKTPSSIQVKQLYLINMAGQNVSAWNTTNLPMSNEIKIPVREIAEGNYILQVETNTNTYNKKIIIKY